MGNFWKNKKWWGILSLLITEFILFQWVTADPARVELHYSRRFYPMVGKLLRFFSGNIPFPVGQVVLIGLTILILILIVRSIIHILRKKKSPGQLLAAFTFRTLVTTAIVYFLFMLCWGINYHRKPLDQVLQMNRSPYTVKELKDLCVVLVNRCNEVREPLTPSDFALDNISLFSMAHSAFRQSGKIIPELNHDHTSVKAVLHPSAMAYLGISGIYFPFTGEANVNMEAPTHELPFTICHEMGHQVGFAKEDEASYISFLVCTDPENSNPVFRYSAYRSALRYSMATLYEYYPEAADSVRTSYGKKMEQDIEISRTYWEQFMGPLADYSEEINDFYLKANEQEEGVQSYNLFVDLLIATYRKGTL